MAKDLPAGSCGFRAIVTHFAFDSDLTWEELSADEDVRLRWETCIADEGDATCKGALITARHWLKSSAMAATKAAIVVEIEWVLQRYLAARKRAALWLKIATANDADQLTSDMHGGMFS